MSSFRLPLPASREQLQASGRALERVWGRAVGEAGPSDGVITPGSLPAVSWEASFELIQPANPSERRAVAVEVENRGRPLCLTLFQGARLVELPPDRATPDDLGTGFLFRHGFAYARIQWQSGFADLPSEAQGVGLAILRDFGVALRTGTLDPAQLPFEWAYLVGYSQGGRFVRTFLREGFNQAAMTADPGRPESGLGTRNAELGRGPVYDGMLCLAGGAGYVPINQVAAEHGVSPDAETADAGDLAPYTWDAVLTRPASDPKVLEVFTTTEYYIRRGSLITERPETFPPSIRHYDLAGTNHLALATLGLAGLGMTEELLWMPANQGGWGLNGGERTGLNYTDLGPYLRASLIILDAWVAEGVEPAPSAIHPLRPADPTELGNPMPGVTLQVPVVDELGNPIGGVRVADVEAPLGSFTPPWLTGDNVISRSSGGFRPLPATELKRRYPDREAYLASYGRAVDCLIEQRFLLAEDRDAILRQALGWFDRLLQELVV